MSVVHYRKAVLNHYYLEKCILKLNALTVGRVLILLLVSATVLQYWY